MRRARTKLLEGHDLKFTNGEIDKDFSKRLSDLFTLNEKRWPDSGIRMAYENLYKQLNDAGILKIFLFYLDGRLAAVTGVRWDQSGDLWRNNRIRL